MKRKITNFMIYIIVFVIILASFIIPNKLFEIQDNNFEMEIYSESDLKNYSISVEAEDIYLVKAIHNIESENYGVMISSQDANGEIVATKVTEQGNIGKIKSEFETLEQYNIIKKGDIFNSSKFSMKIVNKRYQRNVGNYLIHNIYLDVNNSNYQMDIEEQTGKIIKLVLNEENLNDTIEKKKIMENYIQYLDLNIIDDWVYENNEMKSKKADIAVCLTRNVNNGVNILGVNSNEAISKNLIEYVDSKN